MLKRFCLLLALILPMTLLVGCGGKVKLTGTVLYSDDNEPVADGMVYFVNGDFSAHGVIQNGHFSVSSVKENDGLPAGDYEVYFAGIEKVVKEASTNDQGETTEPVTVNAIDVKYLSASTSGIRQKVDRSTKTVEFKLDRAP
ncbi:MAG: hypothetical protein Q4G03_08235 [Planctomycetia bacterium]|nr:hypothetical protein [Planctomycetia bacterium]